jgi:hypothetical protein
MQTQFTLSGRVASIGEGFVKGLPELSTMKPSWIKSKWATL